MARRVKKRIDVPVIMGGSHVSELPEFVLSHPCVDYIIRSEGEGPMVEFILFLQRHKKIEDVPGLGYKQGGKPHFNPLTDNSSSFNRPGPCTSIHQKEGCRTGNLKPGFSFG
ncbi:MAG: cobalamin B12-binding domain-containing protein [Nitrospirae bacterium]|nr:cobalamin B12-binding domain-containing protein [Nitrospirota bacterium]